MEALFAEMRKAQTGGRDFAAEAAAAREAEAAAREPAGADPKPKTLNPKPYQ
jgi:hypothetical protein